MDGLGQLIGTQQPQQEVGATIEDVVRLLQEGVPPQQLMAMGIPEEMIMQAAQLLEQQIAQTNPEGLGGMAIQGGL